ncbi:CBD9-like protein [Trametes elegans]|nr:CBD9-like protein [Trametes elegans]
MRLGPTLALLGISSLAVAHDRRGRSAGDDPSGAYGDEGNRAATNLPSSAVSAGAIATARSLSSSSPTGGSVCTTYMCISGVVNGSNIQYTLQSTGKKTMGWMAMGFGSFMANTPMVILWPNADGSMTLSQRKASGEVMPTVDGKPPRVATADASASDLTGSQPKLSYTIPSDGSAGSQRLIWAFGTTNPGDASESATLAQHDFDGSGTVQLDLSGSSSSPGSGSSAGGAVMLPLQPYQKMIIAHGLLCTIGFLMFLPAGALLARYARTYSSAWFTGHWVFQFALAGPAVVAGVALGIAVVENVQAPHLNDEHKRWGVAIFVLYFAQIALGAVIHWVKPTSWIAGKRRPAQNYVHAVLGIAIVAFAFYQVRTVFREEWPRTSGRPPISKAVDIVWYIWVALVPVLYFAGLVLLPRQFRLERPHKRAPSDEYPMGGQYHDRPSYSARD